MFARDLVAYGDAELDQYLEEHRLEGGGMDVAVEDPQNLPESFLQRLRDRVRRVSDAEESHPVDLGQVTSRLLEICAAENSASRSPSRPLSSDRESSVATMPPTPREDRERKRYKELVNDGGRPLYTIDRVGEVALNPQVHRDLLLPWLDDLDADPRNWEIFRPQAWSWRQFRRWQAHNRKEGRPRYVEVDPSFEEEDKTYNIFVWWFRRGSPDYTEAARKLLAQYDFTRPFQFLQDPTLQDKLTTWVEYLGYECAVHYRYTHLLKQHQPEYDAAWKTLVDAKVLRPFETKEYICDVEATYQHQSETEQALKAVESAKSAEKKVLMLAQEDNNGLRGSRYRSAERVQMMLAAKSKVEAAEESLKSVKTRNEFTTDFIVAARSYLLAKGDAERHRRRLQWILEQVQLIEAEIDGSNVTETEEYIEPRGKRKRGRNQDKATQEERKKQRRGTFEPTLSSGSRATSGSQGEKRKRSHDKSPNDEPPSKRVDYGGQDSGSDRQTPDGADLGSTSDMQGSGIPVVRRPDDEERAGASAMGSTSPRARRSRTLLPQKKSTRNAPQPSAPTQPLRRSARIAARQGALQTTVTTSGSSKLAPRTTQAPARPSSQRSQGQQSQVPEAKIAKRVTRKGSRHGTSRVK